jgi:hypothetical protein
MTQWWNTKYGSSIFRHSSKSFKSFKSLVRWWRLEIETQRDPVVHLFNLFALHFFMRFTIIYGYKYPYKYKYHHDMHACMHACIVASPPSSRWLSLTISLLVLLVSGTAGRRAHQDNMASGTAVAAAISCPAVQSKRFSTINDEDTVRVLAPRQMPGTPTW